MSSEVEVGGSTRATATGVGSRRLTRALATVGGAVAALAVWVVAKYAFDVAMQARPLGGTGPADITAFNVIFSALLGALVGWALLAILERSVQRARTIWTWIAIAGTVLSFVSPLVAPDATTGTKIALLLMHVAVAAVVIPIFARTSPRL
jgi:Family of unknown function (DUF6069)